MQARKKGNRRITIQLHFTIEAKTDHEISQILAGSIIEAFPLAAVVTGEPDRLKWSIMDTDGVPAIPAELNMLRSHKTIDVEGRELSSTQQRARKA